MYECRITSLKDRAMGQTSKPNLKQDWVPTEAAFRRLLDWLDEGRESNGERYLEMRQRLVRYFERKNCLPCDELADESLNRVARKLEEQGTITDASPPHYCYIVAKFVFLEHLRRVRNEATTSQADLTFASVTADAGLAPQNNSEEDQQLLSCLEQCLQRLAFGDRELIVSYYSAEPKQKIPHRRQLAEKLGLTANALSIRACRIRDKLEGCTKKCSAEG
jgi:DNA-directed RNA polymerase specialized sigma24 family protein